MPVVFRHEGYTFFFFSNEGDPREPLHVHVRKGDAVAKIWLQPSAGIAEGFGMSGPELRRLLDIAVVRRQEIEEKWHGFFG